MLQARSVSISAIATIATITICYLALVGAAPYQELAPRKGYVPVYIREGDTPLSEIHPKLAEAFGEIESASLKLEHDDSQVERSDAIAPSTTTAADADKVKAASSEVVPAVSAAEGEGESDSSSSSSSSSEESKSNEKESDIASFDVVKGDVNGDENAEENKNKNAESSVKENENEKAVAE